VYIFACPKCGHNIQADKPASNVPVRCGECGMVFRGSTIAVPGAEPQTEKIDTVGFGGSSKSKATPAPTPSRPRPKKRPEAPVRQEARDDESPVILTDSSERHLSHFRAVQRHQSPTTMIVVSAVGLVGLIVMIVLIVHYSRTARIIEEDEEGQRISDKRLSLDEVGRAKIPPRAPTDEQPDTFPPTPAHPGAGNRSPAPKEPDKTEQGPPRLKPGDPKIKFITWTAVPDVGSDGSTGTLVGRVRNKYASMVETIHLKLQIVDKESGNPLDDPITTVCRNVPPGSSVSFSARYDYVPVAKGAKIDLLCSARIAPNPPEKSVVSWLVNSQSFEHEIRDESIFVLTGSVRNQKAFTVAGVKLYAEFFSADRIMLGSATGKLREQHKDRLRKERTALFIIEFDTSTLGEAGPIPEDIKICEVRLIARAE